MNNAIKSVALGKWMIVLGIAFQFIPGLLGAFLGGGDDSGIVKLLAIVGLILFPVGIVLLIVGAIRRRSLVKEGGATVQTPRTKASLIVWNVLAVILSLPVTFAIIFAGGMASDSGTSSAYATTYVIIGFGVLYFLFTLFCVYMSQSRRSLKWTIWAMAFPAVLIGISMLAPLILLPLLYSAGVR